MQQQQGYAPYPPQQQQYGGYQYPPQQPQAQWGAPPPQQPQYQQGQYQMQPPNAYAPNQQFSNGLAGDKQQQKYEQPGRQDKLKPKTKWNDLPFLLLFWVQFAGFIIVAVISLRALSQDDVTGSLGSSTSGITLDLSTAYLFALIAACGFVLSILYLVFVRAFTRFIFEFTLLLSVLVSVGYAIYLWVVKYWSGAIIFTLFAIFSIICYPFMRKRIPFSRAVLQCVMDVANKNKSIYYISIAGCLIQALYSLLWSFVLAASYQKWSSQGQGSDLSGGSGDGALIVICIFLVFNLYYTSQVLTNVLLVTEAGIFGSWYFSMDSMPSKAGWHSFKRSMTTSFGSICFGSLIVAILDMLRAACRLMQNQAASDGNMIFAAAACVASCCLGCITWLVEFFNRYAYIEIALFGKKYINAAKDAWNLLKQRGIEALVNDCLCNNIWTFGSYICGALCCLFAFIYIRVAEPSFAQDGSSIYAAILLYAFLIGFFIAHCLGGSALGAGVSTIFVALAEEPGALAQKDPALFAEIQRTYPGVLNPV